MNSIFGRKSNAGKNARKRSARYQHRRRLASRQLGTESLESRVLLAGDTVAWHNAEIPMDTTQDGSITGRDALLIVNDLNEFGPRDVDASVTPRGLLDVNADGVVSARDALQIMNYLNAGSGEGERIQVRLEVTAPDSTEPITSIGTDEPFVLRALVTDLRDDALGVFGAYVDVTYNADLANTTGEIDHAGFGNGRDSDLTVDGVIDETGGFSSNTAEGTGAVETLLFAVDMTSEAVGGTIDFAANPADILPNHEVTFFGEDDPVPNDEILFIGTTLEVVSDVVPFMAVADTFDVTDGGVFISAPGVLANDGPVTNDLAVSAFTQPANGTLNLFPQGNFQYIANTGFSGVDTFTYTASDGTQTSTATVTLNVIGEDPPTAVDDDFEVTGGGIFVSPPGVLENDISPSGADLTITENTTTANGTLNLLPTGAFQYVANEGFAGDDTFTYTISDGNQTATATVTITVVADVAGPTAVDDTIDLGDTGGIFAPAPGVLENDISGSGEDLTVTDFTQGTNGGVVNLFPSGAYQYVAPAGFVGTDTFTYTISDGTLTDTATVTVNIGEAINNPPVTNGETYSTPFETSLAVDVVSGVLANDTDADGDALTATLVSTTSAGTLDLQADGAFSYTPNNGFVGQDSFTYSVSDGTDSNQATAFINVLEDTSGDALVAFRIAATDAAGVPLTTVNSGDTFELRVFVDDLSSEPQQGVFAAYTDVEWNAALADVIGPIEFSDIYENGTSGDTSVDGLIDEAGGFDGLQPIGGDEELVFTVPMQASGSGTVTFALNPADTSPFGDVLLFITQTSAVPTDRIIYGSTSLNVVGLSQPVAVGDTYSTLGEPLTVSAVDGVLTNDVPVDTERLAAALVTDVSNGTLTLNSNGSFTYVPTTGFVGTDTFTYRATGSSGSSNVATVTITVGDSSPSSLAGQVYFDTNNNGVRDANEHAFGGTTINLTGTDAFGVDVSLSTTTSRSGTYAFGNLRAGNYTISQVQPGVVLDGIDSASASEGSSSNDAFDVALGSGTDLGGFDFGERGLQSAYFSSPLLFASAVRNSGASIADAGAGSWYCLDAGWEGFQSVSASVSGDVVQLSGITNSGQPRQVAVPVSSPLVRVIGNASNGYLVRLIGSSADYGLDAGVVDSLFAE